MKKPSVVRLYKFSDATLVTTAKEKIAFMRRDVTAFTPFGVTAPLLTTLCNEFEALIIDLKIKIGERDIMQEDRVEAGNTIYKTLVKYTTTGLSIWETSDVAKYNDYVIYNTPSGENTEVVPPTV